MNANQFGRHFAVTTFGESHGAALGAVIDGCPAGVLFDPARLAAWMARRRPGSALASSRTEADEVEVLSGVYEGRTLGTPIAMVVRNQDARSKDYGLEKVVARPGHAVDLWLKKFGTVDPRGSGRASGRETVSRVMAGAVAEMLLKSLAPDLKIAGYVSQIGEWKSDKLNLFDKDWAADGYPLRFPSAIDLTPEIAGAKSRGESFGGTCDIVIRGAPTALGQPVFRKLKSELAAAFMGVGAVHAVEFGEGFSSADRKGSDFHSAEQDYGGLRGGLSTGADIRLRAGFKPTSTLGKMAREGRHDPVILPRAVPVLEAMAWLVLADQVLWSRLDRV